VTTERPRVLIEDWLPVKELGIESRRERAVVTTLPPISWLHVWWARRPLVASAGVVLAGLLPAWTLNLAQSYPDSAEVQSEKAYHEWLLQLVGIWGDPVAARAAYDAAIATGIRIPNPYTYKQAYRNNIPRSDIDLLHSILVATWGELPLVADPTAGGGSIPFVAARLGLPTYANDLNGVAASVLRAGVEYPAVYGTSLVTHLRQWGEVLIQRTRASLDGYFPSAEGEAVATFLYANSVACPRTGKPVPLMKDKWLRRDEGKEAAVTITFFDDDGKPLDSPRFDIATGADVDKVDARAGFVSNGRGVSPYDNLVIDPDYIKAEAQAGRMTQVLYAVAVRNSRGDRQFRAPTDMDMAALRNAETEFNQVKADWMRAGYLPTETIPQPLPKHDIRPYGLTHWLDMFTPRQALVHGTFAKVLAEMAQEVREALGDNVGNAVLFELAMAQGKAVNWNSRLSSWNVGSQGMRSVFDRHDFSFKWTFAEFEGAHALYTWCLDRCTVAYEGIALLLEGTGAPELQEGGSLATGVDRTVTVTQGSATNLAGLRDGSVAHLCMDPPYYDNVMYGELADYLYVWEKHTLGRIEPAFFTTELSDQDNEAVANIARFLDAGRRRNELADLDYEAKMTAIFEECRRVLREDGVMSVMFTHKRAEAWDTLGMGLLNAGFTIETSWPVNTERELSLHQVNVNSAASTIMLVCRKRKGGTRTQVFLDDIEGDIRTAARDALSKYREFGIDGVDLLLATYGPVLSVISEAWPVYSTEASDDGSARLLRPDEALDIARQEVMRLQRKRIVGKDTVIDNHTDFLMLAWETYGANTGIPFDSARQLALAVGGLDMDELARAKVLEKKSGKVRLLAPRERVVRRGGDDQSTGVRIDATSFQYMNDALDTVLYIWEEDGPDQAKAFMDRLGLTSNERFLAAVQGFVNAVPRVKVKGEWTVPLAGRLDTLCTLYLPDVTLPESTELVKPAEVETKRLF
jgi:adenine-specific DNA methylase